MSKKCEIHCSASFRGINKIFEIDGTYIDFCLVGNSAQILLGIQNFPEYPLNVGYDFTIVVITPRLVMG